MNSVNFFESIKIVPDYEMELLLSIQNEIAKNTSPENISKLTKNLSDNQKKALKELYLKQIESLNCNIKNCKKKILKIKSNIKK